MKLRNYKVYIIFITAFLLTVFFYLIYWHDFSVPRYNYKPGEVAQISIRAPFAFNVQKSEMMIEAEVASGMQNYSSQYVISDEIKFNTLKRLDSFFVDLNNIVSKKNSNDIVTSFNSRGFRFSDPFMNYLLLPNNRDEVYRFLALQLPEVMSLPIIYDEDKGNNIRLSDNLTHSQLNIITISEAKKKILDQVTNPSHTVIVSELLDLLLMPNLAQDMDSYNKEKQNIRRTVDPMIMRIDDNEYIVQKNNRITELDILKLNSLSQALEDKKGETKTHQHIFIAFGRFLFNLLLLSTFYYMTRFFYVKRYLKFNRMCVTYGSFILIVLVIAILYSFFSIPYIILIPIPMFVLLIALLFTTRYTILFIFFTLMISGQYLNWDMLPLINLTFASLVCLIVIRKTNQTNFLLIFIYLLCALGLSAIISAIYRLDSFESILLNLTFAFINTIVSVVGAILVIPLIEKKLGFATKNSLLNLMDYNSPILRRLAKEAQGTYYHSVIVGNLSEECAMAVGADHLLARVGSYYHDIGKLENPLYFSENNLGENPHDKLNPIESAYIIKNHVRNGVVLADKIKLPEQVIEIIQQHHGDNKIKYFLYKAKEMGLEFNESDFMYAGPKPKTKEASIVMIADVVESTAKASKDQSETAISKIIEDSINNIIAEEQLSESPLTIQELAIIKQTMLPIMCSIYRKRV